MNQSLAILQMAKPIIPKTYPENNPHDKVAKATQWLLTSVEKRQKLYHYLRELKDQEGRYDPVSASWAEELTSYSNQSVSEKDGFSAEEADYINGELAQIYKLRLKAYPYVQGVV